MIERQIENDFVDFKNTLFESIKNYPVFLGQTLFHPLRAVQSVFSESWFALVGYTFVTTLVSQLPWALSLEFSPYFLETSFNFVFDAAVISFGLHLWVASENRECDIFLPLFKSLLVTFIISTVYCLPLSLFMLRTMLMIPILVQAMVGIKVGVYAWLFYYALRAHAHLPQKYLLTVSVLAALFSSYVIPRLL